MNIREWVSKHPIGKRGEAIRRIATACKVEPSAVRHWLAGKRGVRPSYWPALIGVTGGEVTAADLLMDATNSPSKAA
jgi:DNA-binding transcriptional regulator YdaS (Cro superfamily)